MKLTFLIYIFFIPTLFCFLRKKSESESLAAPKKVKTEEPKYQGLKLFLKNTKSKEYGKSLFDKINEYRTKQYGSSKMGWVDKLENSAQKEALEIINQKRFGSHDKFSEWENSIRNDYFTEIAVKIEWNNKELPAKNIFAKDVLTALIQDDKFYVVQDYTFAGVGIQQNSKNKNEYIIVLHLAQKAKKESCKDANAKGNKVKSVNIIIGGNEETLQCDQTTEGGGWTLIADVNEYSRGKRLIVPIDDKGLDYTEIMFEAKPYFYFNYVNGKRNVWDFDSYNFRQTAIRFNGDEWYADKKHQRYKIKYINYDRTKDIKVLEKGKRCFYGSSNQLDDCAKKFIFKTLPKGKRVDGFSEMESAANVAFTDNIYRFYFKLYVR